MGSACPALHGLHFPLTPLQCRLSLTRKGLPGFRYSAERQGWSTPNWAWVRDDRGGCRACHSYTAPSQRCEAPTLPTSLLSPTSGSGATVLKTFVQINLVFLSREGKPVNWHHSSGKKVLQGARWQSLEPFSPHTGKVQSQVSWADTHLLHSVGVASEGPKAPWQGGIKMRKLRLREV